MQRIEGVVHHYAWGDHDFLPRLLGLDADGRPWAELWLGTHPKAPARFDDGRLLTDTTGELGFLLKVLACSQPLSLQTHPNAEQARAGYDSGVFGDPHPKPELLCALTNFRALCGFRSIDESAGLLREVGAADLADCVANGGIEAALHNIYHLGVDVDAIVESCRSSSLREAEVCIDIAKRYPGDPSAIVSLLMHHVELQPGEALRLDAGNLHAYLCGAGIELMGASDNVVRAGMTVKEVDVDLLLDIVDTTPDAAPVLQRANRYELPDAAAELTRLGTGETWVAPSHAVAVDELGATWHVGPGEAFTAAAPTYVAHVAITETP